MFQERRDGLQFDIGCLPMIALAVRCCHNIWFQPNKNTISPFGSGCFFSFWLAVASPSGSCCLWLVIFLLLLARVTFCCCSCHLLLLLVPLFSNCVALTIFGLSPKNSIWPSGRTPTFFHPTKSAPPCHFPHQATPFSWLPTTTWIPDSPTRWSTVP